MSAAAALKVLFVTPECAPWVKTGGLGDVSAALPAALAELGHDVRVLMPAYRSLAALAREGTQRVTLPADGVWPEAELVRVAQPGFSLWLLDCADLFGLAGGPYGDERGVDYASNAERFGFLSHVAARIASGATPWKDWQAEVLHANDWPTGLAAAYLRRMPPPRARSLFTIHNLAFQGNFPPDRQQVLDLPDAWMQVEGEGLLHWDRISMMKAALRHADVITTVSPTYAREIQEEALGFGMDGMLRARQADLHGILNGIDTRVWNPVSDPLIPARYGAGCLDDKAANKQALQVELGLAVSDHAPLFGIVSRLTDQKGIDLILDNLDWLLKQGAQLAVLGSGEPRYEKRLNVLAAELPSQVAVRTGFDEPLAHTIEAGADVFLMPSRFEPCGLNQMYSQAYGTLPVVRATGGLADSVRDASGPDGTGFVFQRDSAADLRETLMRVLRCYRQPALWRGLQQRAMAQRFGWAQSAERYVALYKGQARKA
ncbi:glycogen synthase GlgA [Rhizobacter sp. J219]|uniref:glycogen synthase GlgA n=1 Tax=Rhizobacter sp. J219 TaxID=2898430 RepID=UPI0021509171|nr:glycogen synthase GlgA [Rhizobacter sp. J219]MCR5882093.1 glycogen synthase GlgA [Rhizobacter sp. J219]